MSAKKLAYVADPNKFDLRTHEWDAQGKLVKTNLYRSFIIDGRQYFERPVNSGNLWFENNQPAGRVEYVFGADGKIASKKFQFDQPHKDYKAPLSADEKMHYELEQERERNRALEAELAKLRSSSKEVKQSGGELAMLHAVREGLPAAGAAPVKGTGKRGRKKKS